MSMLIWQSEIMRKLIAAVKKVAVVDTSVLIYGETGTGKELVARMIHDLSPRSRGPFVAVNCGAISGGLSESTFFGHRKGSFTGAASDYKGHFVACAGGTFFLDELGEMSKGVQAELLRALQEQEVMPIGSSQPVKIDVRMVAASSVDLAKEADQERFHPGLFYRLNSFPLTVPPLRGRPNDIPLLAEHFLARRKRLSPSVIKKLRAYDWPGNVRELQSVMEYALIVAEGPSIRLQHLPGTVLEGPRKRLPPHGDSPRQTLRDLDREHIFRVLRYTHWNQARAARILGIDGTTLYRKLRRYIEDGELSASDIPSRRVRSTVCRYLGRGGVRR